MLITGARVTINANEAVKLNLWLYSGRVSFTRIRQAEDTIFDLEGCLILPGLINAHDHLEMNLFPRLGNGPYENAARWAEDIYHPCHPPIKDHLAVPKYIRLTWGAIKNLLSGVTTVAHHNPLHPSLFDYDLPIRVLKRFNWAHSLKFSPDWLSTFRDTPQNAHSLCMWLKVRINPLAASYMSWMKRGRSLNRPCWFTALQLSLRTSHYCQRAAPH